MDYNWLENVPSSLTPVPVYQPDFGFLQSMQMKANQQYEQGLKEVKNSFSSIFNKQVTGEEATKRQNDYKKQALTQMKAIAATDLSDPKNVQIAEDILSPFYDDKLYLKNIAMTSHFQTQFGKLEAMRNSKDKEERLLYRSWMSEYLNQAYEQLGSAPMTEDAYAKIEKREALPVYDIGADAAKEFGEIYGKDGITTTDLNGNIMATSKNGPKSVAAFNTFYKSVASREKYAPQLRAFAVTEMGRAIKKIKEDIPGITDQQAKAKFGEKSINELLSYHGKLISDANQTALELRNKNASLIPLDSNGWPKQKMMLDPVKDKGKIDQIISNYANAKKYQDLAEQYKQDFTKSFGYVDSEKNAYSTNPFDFINSLNKESEQYKKTINDITTAPEDYIKNVYVDHDANNWAVGKASITSVKYEENPITKSYNDQTNKQFDQQMKLLQFQTMLTQKDRAFGLKELETMRKLGIDINKETLSELLPDYPGYKDGDMFNAATGFGSSAIGGGGRTGGSKGRGVPSLGSGTISAPGTDNTKVLNLDNFKIDQARRINNVNALSFSLEGNLQVISKNVLPNGLEPDEIVSLAGDLQNCIETGKYNMDPKAVAIRQKFVNVLNSQKLTDYTKNGTRTNPNDFRMGLSALINNSTTQDFFISADPEKIAVIQNIARQNKVVQKEMADYLKYDKEYKERITEFIKNNNTNGRINKLLNDDRSDVVDTDDVIKVISKIIPDQIKLRDGTILTHRDIAQAYLSGNFDYSKSYVTEDYMNYIIVNGVKIGADDIDNVKNTQYAKRNKYLDPSDMFDEDSEKLVNVLKDRFGKSENISTLLKKVGEDVIQKIPGYSTGLSGSVMTYDISGEGKEIDPTQKATGIKLAQEGFVPNNFDKIYIVDDANKMDKQLEQNVKAALINHTSWETTSDLFESVKYHPQGPNGKPAIEVVFSPTKEGDSKKKIGDVAYSDLKPMGGGKIFIDIAEGAKGDLIKGLPEQKSSYRYGQLLYSTDAIVQDGFEENSGFRYKVMADPKSKDATGRYTKAYVFSEKWAINDDGTVKVDDKGNPIFENQITSTIDLMTGNNPKSPDDVERLINSWMDDNINERLILRKANQQSSAPAGTFVDLNQLLQPYK